MINLWYEHLEHEDRSVIATVHQTLLLLSHFTGAVHSSNLGRTSWSQRLMSARMLMCSCDYCFSELGVRGSVFPWPHHVPDEVDVLVHTVYRHMCVHMVLHIKCIVIISVQVRIIHTVEQQLQAYLVSWFLGSAISCIKQGISSPSSLLWGRPAEDLLSLAVQSIDRVGDPPVLRNRTDLRSSLVGDQLSFHSSSVPVSISVWISFTHQLLFNCCLPYSLVYVVSSRTAKGLTHSSCLVAASPRDREPDHLTIPITCRKKIHCGMYFIQLNKRN